jgi:hypothetical protein
MRQTAALAGLLLAASALAETPQTQVALEKLPDRVRVTMGGSLFTEYVFTYKSRPYLYPILGPGQLPMTRNWPMKELPGEEKDHPHHRSLWFAHGDVNGIDFWSEAKGAGKVVHRGFDIVEAKSGVGTIKARNDWVDRDDKLVCSEERTLRFCVSPVNPASRIIDFEAVILASEQDLVFGDTKEGMMAIRLAESMRLKGIASAGRIINSEGDRDNATWGKRAKWCDYYGPSDGKTAGVAILDHPSNHAHPTWWHVRDYGLFAANPFGRHDFEKLADKQAGALTVKKGSRISFRFRFVFHQGNDVEGKIPAEYAAYAPR